MNEAIDSILCATPDSTPCLMEALQTRRQDSIEKVAPLIGVMVGNKLLQCTVPDCRTVIQLRALKEGESKSGLNEVMYRTASSSCIYKITGKQLDLFS